MSFILMLLINEKEFLILFNTADLAFYSAREALQANETDNALKQLNVLNSVLKELKGRCTVCIYPPS